jgi:hypothetical protein
MFARFKATHLQRGLAWAAQASAQLAFEVDG